MNKAKNIAWWGLLCLSVIFLVIFIANEYEIAAYGIGEWGLNKTTGWAVKSFELIFVKVLITLTAILSASIWCVKSGHKKILWLTSVTMVVALIYFIIAVVLSMHRPWLGMYWALPFPNDFGSLWVNFRMDPFISLPSITTLGLFVGIFYIWNSGLKSRLNDILELVLKSVSAIFIVLVVYLLFSEYGRLPTDIGFLNWWFVLQVLCVAILFIYTLTLFAEWTLGVDLMNGMSNNYLLYPLLVGYAVLSVSYFFNQFNDYTLLNSQWFYYLPGLVLQILWYKPVRRFAVAGIPVMIGIIFVSSLTVIYTIVAEMHVEWLPEGWKNDPFSFLEFESTTGILISLYTIVVLLVVKFLNPRRKELQNIADLQ